MPWFGYRINLLGPVTAWKAEERQSSVTTLTQGDWDSPYTQQRPISDEEYALSLDELRANYPYDPLHV